MSHRTLQPACAALMAVLLTAVIVTACESQASPLPTPTRLPETRPTVVKEVAITVVMVTSTAVPTPTPAATETPAAPVVMGEISVDGSPDVNVRSGPSMLYDRIGSLPDGQEVQITGRSPQGEWLRIRANGLEGWVYALYMLVKDNPQAVPCVGPTGGECTDQPAPAVTIQPTNAGLVVEPKQSTNANGIRMTLEKVDMAAAYTNLFLCYQKPTHQGNSDWMLPHATTLQAGNHFELLDTYGLLFDQDYGLSDGKYTPPEGGRCVSMGLPLGHSNQPGPLNLTLTVPYLEKSQPEVIPEAEIQAANAKLKWEGIEMSFHTFQAVGGGGGGPVIVHKPEGMSDTDVLRRFYAALGYYYTGPWVFTLTIPVPGGAAQPDSTANTSIARLFTQTPDPLPVDRIVLDLKQKIQFTLFANSWVWQKMEVIQFGSREYIPRLPNGDPYPSDYFWESWYHLNDQKLIDQSITWTKNTAGEILATVIVADRLMHSPWLPQPKTTEPQLSGDFDRGFLDIVQKFSSTNKHAVRQTSLDGQPVICISAGEAGPTKLEGYEQTVQLNINEGCYDPITGWQRQEESRLIFADGTEIITSRFKNEIRAGGTPPEDVLRQIEAVSH